MPGNTPYPEQTYAPSWRVTLSIRFEEYGNNALLKQSTPTKPTKNLRGISDESAPLVVVTDPKAPQGSRQWLLQTAAGKGSDTQPSGPAQARAESSDGLTHDLTCVPRSAELELNGLRTADTLKFQMRYIDAPFDPRTIRACGVQFYLGTISQDQFAAGIRGENAPNGDSMLLVPATFVDSYGRTRSNLRFQGWVDKWTVEFTEDGEPMISVECRDNTQLFIDTEVAPKLLIDVVKPIDEAVAGYISHFPTFEGVTVQYRGDYEGQSPPALGNAISKSAYQPKLHGLPPSAGGAPAAGADSKLNVWDFLTDVCGAIGHIIHVDGTNIVIEKVSTRWSSKNYNSRPDDPFLGRDDFTQRTFVYGSNLLTLKVERGYTRKSPQNTEVRCFNSEKNQLLVGRYPDKNGFVAMGLPGDGGKDQKWSVHYVTGLLSTDQCVAVAREYYEQAGRQEVEVNMTTKNLASLGGGNLDPDILDMRAGDAFEILIDRDVDAEYATINKVEAALKLQNRASAHLQALGFSEKLSNAYAKVYSDAGFQKIFRLKQMSVKCDANEGVSFDIKGHNFVEVRADVANLTAQDPYDNPLYSLPRTLPQR